MSVRVLLMTFIFASCGGAPSDPPSRRPPATQDVASLELDGYLLMVGGNPYVLDPATGKTARTAPDLVDVVAVAPDGMRFVARTAPAPDGPVGPNIITSYTSDLAEYRVAAGPTLTELRRIPKGNTAHYSPDGDWLASSTAVYDLATDASYPCVGARFFPEGRWLCEGSEALMTRGTLLAADVRVVAPDGEPARVPADGQLVNVETHSQSGATRAAPHVLTYDEEFVTAQPLPDGSFLSAHDSANGVIVTSLFANGVTTYQRTTVTEPAPDGYRYDFAEAFRDGTWSDPARGDAAARDARQRKMVAALTPWFDDGEGRRFGPAAITADGAVIWRVHSHAIVAGVGGILEESTREDAYVEVAADGTTRGFRLTDVSELHLTSMSARFVALTQPELAPYGVVDLPGGDWLRESSGQVATHWLGYLDGAPVALMDAGRMSRDGRYFLRDRTAAQGNGVSAVCVREVAKAAPEKCLPHPVARVIELVGQGLTDTDSAPVIRNVSRVAAWPGSTVTVHGARLGTSGTLTVGGVAVATTTWSDHRIDFLMDEALPLAGDLVVTTAAGDSNAHRRFVLHRTARLPTPFDAVSTAPITLGQGQNLVAFGDIELRANNPGSHRIDDPVSIDPSVRTPDGRIVVTSSGATPATTLQTPVSSGAYSRTLEVQLADRLADDDHGHLLFIEPDPDRLVPMFTDLAGQLVTESQGVLSDTRVDVRSLPNPSRMPECHRVDPSDGRVWVMSFVNYGANGGASQLVGWHDATGRWGYGQTAPGRYGGFNGAIGVASYGDVVILTGSDLATNRPHFRLSHDAGATWDITTTIDTLTGPAFAEPIAVAHPTPHFIVFESHAIGAQVTGVHRVDLDGTFTPNVMAAPPNFKTWHIKSSHGDARCFEVDSHDDTFVAFAPASGTLIAADPSGARTLPTAADATHIRAAFRAPDAFYAVRDDGTVWRATKASRWADWAALDLAIDLHIPAVLDIRAIGISGDRMFVRANMTAPGGGRHPYGDAGFFVAPRVP